jgi:hypothetical protein
MEWAIFPSPEVNLLSDGINAGHLNAPKSIAVPRATIWPTTACSYCE